MCVGRDGVSSASLNAENLLNRLSNMNETPQSIGKVGRCYRLFVIAQAVMLFAVIGFRSFAPNRDHTPRTLSAYANIQGGLKTSLEMFNIDCGRYPTSKEGWKILVSPSAEGSFTNWHGPYLDPAAAPLDPWGHEYVYRYPGLHNTNGYDLYSPGPDGVSKSDGNDADDISNWEKPPREKTMELAFLIDSAERLLLLIPILFVAGVIAQLIFPQVRAVALKEQWADWLWLALTAIVLVALLVPKIHGRTF